MKKNFLVEDNIKKYLKTNNYKLSLLDRYKIQKAVLEMLKSLDKLNVENFNIDNISKINIKAFEAEEKYFDENKKYILLSFISIIFIDLGIITFREIKKNSDL